MSRRQIRLNVSLLALCQALFMTSTSAVVTSVALVGFMLAEHKGLSTFPIAFQFAATMATAYPASIYMRRVGRKAGFITGAAIGMLGAGTASAAILAGDFWLFCLGAALIGSFNAFAQYFRFAAADVADDAFRSRAISLVLAGGVVAAVTGPNLARLTRDLFDPVSYAGTFAAIVAVYIAIIAVVAVLRIPRPAIEERSGAARPLAEILRQPECRVAILGAVIGYLVMSFLMTITPLAMADNGFTFDDSVTVIQWHIIGMFLPSFFTGHLIARFGVANVMACGAALQGGCIAINIAGLDFANFVVSLTLVGIGWNFLFIGGTSLLTRCYAPSEKAKVQGFNDFCIWGAVMSGALLSGAAHYAFGWTVVNFAVMPLVALILAVVLYLKFRLRYGST